MTSVLSKSEEGFIARIRSISTNSSPCAGVAASPQYPARQFLDRDSLGFGSSLQPLDDLVFEISTRT
jgi:hypothetical protein